MELFSFAMVVSRNSSDKTNVYNTNTSHNVLKNNLIIKEAPSLEQLGISMGIHKEDELPLTDDTKINVDKIHRVDLTSLNNNNMEISHQLHGKDEFFVNNNNNSNINSGFDINEDFQQQNKRCFKISWQSALRISILTILLAGIGTFLGFLIGSNNVQTSMITALEWLSHLPKWGSSLLMVGIYSVALLLFCPGTPFNLAAGFLFGMWLGCGVALGGCVLGAIFAFLLGRTIARDWVKDKMEKRPKFKAVDWAIQKNGLYIVFLTRLSPLFPFPLLNYAFGITKVQVWQYFGGTLAGVMPATLAYTYLGTLMRNLTDIWTATDVTSDDLTDGSAKKKNPNLVWLIVGSILTLLSIIVISLITKRAIAKATREYSLQNGGNEKGSSIDNNENKIGIENESEGDPDIHNPHFEYDIESATTTDSETEANINTNINTAVNMNTSMDAPRVELQEILINSDT